VLFDRALVLFFSSVAIASIIFFPSSSWSESIEKTPESFVFICFASVLFINKVTDVCTGAVPALWLVSLFC
jgi:hypothetical protein